MILINGVPLGKSLIEFPSGEQLIRLEPNQVNMRNNDVALIYQSDKDLIAFLLLADSLKRLNIDISGIDVFCPYLPSSRADRVEIDGESHGLSVYSSIIEKAGFKSLVVCDVHSSVAQSCFSAGKFFNISLAEIIGDEVASSNQTLFNKSGFSIYQGDVVAKTLMDFVSLGVSIVFIAPDKGAVKRASQVASLFGSKVLFAEKVRDYSTGKILESKIENMIFSSSTNPVHYVVVDDTCAGGGTFKGLAESMKNQYNINKDQMSLIVTHGLFNNSVAVKSSLFEYYSNVLPVFDYTKVEA